VKILLDECVDRRFARDLVGHEVVTVPRKGWAGIKNGELLVLAEKEFDAFITLDRKLATQQDLTKFKMGQSYCLAHGQTGLKTFARLQPKCFKNLPRAIAGTLTIISS